jgi:monovalent cation/hydrogen antiporter
VFASEHGLSASETFIILMAVVTAFGVLARWLRLPYPILLVVGGLVLSFQPWLPHELIDRYQLPPELALLAFLPPLLYAAAFNTEWAAFRKQLRAISLLAVGLVLFTAVGVAAVCHFCFGLPWVVGFVLGAVISPPDAVAATAITSRIKVPRIVVTILEGESLVNDATALVAYRLAVAAVGTGAFVWWESALEFVKVSAGGIAIGVAGAVAVIWLHRFLNRRDLADAKLNIVITLLTPYAVYLPAEHLHVSGVLACVACGLWVGSRCGQVFDHELYIEAKAVWEMVEFVLNGVIFILIGFQLPLILDGLSAHGDGHTLGELVGMAAVVTAVVIAARMLWVFPGAYLPRWFDRVLKKAEPYPPWQAVAVVGWTGMRGVVSLAVALALPHKLDDGTPFPHRDLILFLTFWAIFGTLVGQGLTLPLLIRLLKVDRMAEAEPPDEEPAAC